MTRTFLDAFGNKATITQRKIRPYKDSPVKEISFILTCKAPYEKNLTYFKSIYATFDQALDKLQEFSLNTWEELIF